MTAHDQLATFLASPYHNQLVFNAPLLSDYEASLQLDHQRDDDNTLICSLPDASLYLVGCTTLHMADGTYLSGSQISQYCQANHIPMTQLLDFLQGKDDPLFEECTVETNPWFQWQNNDNDDDFSEAFSDLPHRGLLWTQALQTLLQEIEHVWFTVPAGFDDNIAEEDGGNQYGKRYRDEIYDIRPMCLTWLDSAIVEHVDPTFFNEQLDTLSPAYTCFGQNNLLSSKAASEKAASLSGILASRVFEIVNVLFQQHQRPRMTASLFDELSNVEDKGPLFSVKTLTDKGDRTLLVGTSTPCRQRTVTRHVYLFSGDLHVLDYDADQQVLAHLHGATLPVAHLLPSSIQTATLDPMFAQRLTALIGAPLPLTPFDENNILPQNHYGALTHQTVRAAPKLFVQARHLSLALVSHVQQYYLAQANGQQIDETIDTTLGAHIATLTMVGNSFIQRQGLSAKHIADFNDSLGSTLIQQALCDRPFASQKAFEWVFTQLLHCPVSLNKQDNT